MEREEGDVTGSTGRASKRREAMTAWLFLAPFMAVYIAFLVYPFAKGVWISLYHWNVLAVAMNPDAKSFVGLKNYIHLFWGRGLQWGIATRPVLQGLCVLAALLAAWAFGKKRLSRSVFVTLVVIALFLFFLFGWAPGPHGRWYDRRFWPTVGNTVLFVAIVTPSVTALSLVLAAVLNRETRAMSVFRTIFFLSQVLSVTVVTLIWQILFSPQEGLIANVVTLFGGTPISWLTDQGFAMAAIAITTIWWSTGIAMILFLAGLQEISTEIYEAAKLDDAGPVQTFWYITVPNMKRTIGLVLVLQIILQFQVFGQSHLMTHGGPDGQTQVLVRYIYQTAFRDSELGRASAIAVFLFAIMAGFSAAQFLLSRGEGK